MMVYPRTDWGVKASLIAIPVVGLLVWLFNSYKLGKFRKPEPSDEDRELRLGRDRRSVVVHAGIAAIIVVLLMLLRD